MRVDRGRGADPAADHERTRSLTRWAAETREPALRVWCPPQVVAFGRRDRQASEYEQARERAGEAGYPVAERQVGGHAVAFTGETIAFALVEPVAGDHRQGIQARYDRVLAAVESALSDRGVPTARGEPPASFCPGSHSLRLPDGGKLVGLAQRVRQETATVAGVLVTDAAAVTAVLAPVYHALDMPFEPDAVGDIPNQAGAAYQDTLATRLRAAATPERNT
jgi:lipoate-protein ligase A